MSPLIFSDVAMVKEFQKVQDLFFDSKEMEMF